jgi:5'-nucleotidase
MAVPPFLLLSNDDGIHAPGLAVLRQACLPLGEVQIIAPDMERSANSHAITMHHPLRVTEIKKGGSPYGQAVNGTPADCVKLGITSLVKRRPDLVLSGINQGPNTGTHVIYSGTVGAAMEAAVFGIPGIAVSLAAYGEDKDFSLAANITARLAERVLKYGLPDGMTLNVNVPALPLSDIHGIRLTHQAKLRYRDHYVCRQDPRGRNYYWLDGESAEVLDDSPSADANAVKQGYISITPLGYDLTTTHFQVRLQTWIDELLTPDLLSLAGLAGGKKA